MIFILDGETQKKIVNNVIINKYRLQKHVKIRVYFDIVQNSINCKKCMQKTVSIEDMNYFF
jgi:hypothetical protein